MLPMFSLGKLANNVHWKKLLSHAAGVPHWKRTAGFFSRKPQVCCKGFLWWQNTVHHLKKTHLVSAPRKHLQEYCFWGTRVLWMPLLHQNSPNSRNGALEAWAERNWILTLNHSCYWHLPVTCRRLTMEAFTVTGHKSHTSLTPKCPQWSLSSKT